MNRRYQHQASDLAKQVLYAGKSVTKSSYLIVGPRSSGKSYYLDRELFPAFVQRNSLGIILTESSFLSATEATISISEYIEALCRELSCHCAVHEVSPYDRLPTIDFTATEKIFIVVPISAADRRKNKGFFNNLVQRRYYDFIDRYLTNDRRKKFLAVDSWETASQGMGYMLATKLLKQFDQRLVTISDLGTLMGDTMSSTGKVQLTKFVNQFESTLISGCQESIPPALHDEIQVPSLESYKFYDLNAGVGDGHRNRAHHTPYLAVHTNSQTSLARQ